MRIRTAMAVFARLYRGPRATILAAALFSCFCLVSSHATAQGVSDSQLQQLMQQRSSSASGQTQPALQGTQTILQPTSPPQRLPTSRLERIMSSRAGAKLSQFGYDQLGSSHAVTIPQVGAIQDNYVLGPGDELVIVLRGQENAEYRTRVDRDGRVLLPRLPPIPAAGRNFADFRQDLLTAIHRAYVATEGYVSVGQLRQISVLVSGEVNNPGTRVITGLSTVANAIAVSGGVKKSGSLRRIYVVRGGKRQVVDLYRLLTTEGANSSVTLKDGDQIVVPPLGPTVAIAGWVRRPGIYELPAGQSSEQARTLLKLAGGMEVRGKYRFSIMHVSSDGINKLRTVSGLSARLVDSDIFLVQPGAYQTDSTVTLAGGTALAGQYVASNTKLSTILKSPGAMGPNPYTVMGIISRKDTKSFLRKLTPFTPVSILGGKADLNVQTGDIVRVLSAPEAQRLLKIVDRYIGRRDEVNVSLRTPGNPTAGGQSTNRNQSANGQSTNGQSANGQSPGMQTSSVNRGNAVSLQTHWETENQSLIYVERQIADEDRDARNAAAVNQAAPQLPATRRTQQTGTSAQQNSLGDYQAADENDRASSGDNGSGQSGTGMFSQGRKDHRQQVIGPYRGAYSNMAPTLGENMEQQALNAGQVPTNQEVLSITDLAEQLDVSPIVLVNFLRDHIVSVDGAVNGAGNYFVGPDADFASVLQAAGGLSRLANRSNIEIISTSVNVDAGTSRTARQVVSLADNRAANLSVSPGDNIRVSSVFTDAQVGSVMVQGQVRNTGTFRLTRGEHLSDLLMRAGGVTDDAYPYGTVFLRKAAAAREKEALSREAQEIENQLLTAMARRNANEKLAPDAFTAVQSYVDQLRNQKALGRVTVIADPAVLAAHPALDPLLQPGDFIYIPMRPYAVAVLGQVLQPGSIPFTPKMSAKDYIDAAGGYSQFADTGHAIVVLPDGSARQVEDSWLNIQSQKIPPGSTIYVARDISGVDLHQIIIDTTQIFGQLATSAAALAVLSRQ